MIYVVEIEGRGIAAFADKDTIEEPGFKEDLLALTSQGKPLWNGRAELFIRDAFPEEQGKWRAAQTRALRDDEVGDESENWVCFLVPIDADEDDSGDDE